jgi:hypothetical protein
MPRASPWRCERLFGHARSYCSPDATGAFRLVSDRGRRFVSSHAGIYAAWADGRHGIRSILRVLSNSDSDTVNKPGVNGGAGIAFGTKWHGKIFAEARYHRIFMGNGAHTDYIPVSFGFRWYRRYELVTDSVPLVTLTASRSSRRSTVNRRPPRWTASSSSNCGPFFLRRMF